MGSLEIARLGLAEGHLILSCVRSCPGEKLQVLKAKLQEAMKLRRTEERQKRQALFKLDNEDMLEEEEEEEEDMTDESEEEEEGSHEVCVQNLYIIWSASPFCCLFPVT